MREMAGWLVFLTTLQGCVLYAKDRGSCDGDDDDTGEEFEGPAAPADPETPVEPDPEPFALALTPAHGEAGATVLA
nr:hypothetical protein [Deltaproteobacteria bacterium]